MSGSPARDKLSPKPERLKIEVDPSVDPEDALQKLLNTPPPEKEEPEAQQDSEEPQGD